MRGKVPLVVLVVGLFFVFPVQADEVVGAIWMIEFKADKADKSSIKLQCTKAGKVFGPGGKEIGTWKGKGDQATITITDGGPRNGVYEITQLEKNPPTFRGKYTNEKGKEIRIAVTLVKD